MPTTVQVKVNTVTHTTQQSKAGNDLNYVEITGFDAAAGKGFKKRCFATKKDGTATKNAETADSLSQNDWVEITMDDSSYKNIQTIKKIAEPAGMSAPDQSEGKATTSQPASSPAKSTKAFRTTGQLNREKALDAALKYLTIRGIKDGVDNVGSTLDVARRFEDYLVTDANAVDGEPRGSGNMTVHDAATSQKILDDEEKARKAAATEPTPGPQDDDIPF
jgi:hypothetical protein